MNAWEFAGGSPITAVLCVWAITWAIVEVVKALRGGKS